MKCNKEGDRLQKLKELVVALAAVAVPMVLGIMGFYGEAIAAWSNDHDINTPIAAAGNQFWPNIASDGAGGLLLYGRIPKSILIIRGMSIVKKNGISMPSEWMQMAMSYGQQMA